MKKHLFSKLVVVYCVLVSTGVTGAVLFICWRSGEISAGIVSALLALWGGELLLLCLKRILGDSSSPKDKKTDKWYGIRNLQTFQMSTASGM